MTGGIKRLGWKGRTLAAVALATAVAGAGWYWLAPALAADQIRSALADVWDGPVAIDALRLHWDGQVTIEALSLLDEQKRLWARFEGVTIRPARWPSLDAGVRDVRIIAARFYAHAPGRGALAWSGRRGGTRWPESIEIGRLTLAGPGPRGDLAPGGEVHLTLTGGNESFQFTAESIRSNAPDALALAGTAEVGESGVTVRATGSAWGGRFVADAGWATGRDGAPQQSLNLSADGLDLEAVLAFLGRPRPAPGGRLGVRCSLQGKAGQWADLECRQGVLTFTGAALDSLGPVGAILSGMGLPEEPPGARGDLAARFTAVGSQVYLQKVELTTSQSAVLAEPGGAVDLRTGEFSVYLLGLPFRGPGGELADRLLRVHVQGPWAPGARRRIRHQVLHDLSPAAANFFRSAASAAARDTEDDKSE